MTGHDLLAAREQLAQGIGEFNSPPYYPMNASPWIAMALLQKATQTVRLSPRPMILTERR